MLANWLSVTAFCNFATIDFHLARDWTIFVAATLQLAAARSAWSLWQPGVIVRRRLREKLFWHRYIKAGAINRGLPSKHRLQFVSEPHNAVQRRRRARRQVFGLFPGPIDFETVEVPPISVIITQFSQNQHVFNRLLDDFVGPIR